MELFENNNNVLITMLYFGGNSRKKNTILRTAEYFYFILFYFILFFTEKNIIVLRNIRNQNRLKYLYSFLSKSQIKLFTSEKIGIVQNMLWKCHFVTQ